MEEVYNFKRDSCSSSGIMIFLVILIIIVAIYKLVMA